MRLPVWAMDAQRLIIQGRVQGVGFGPETAAAKSGAVPDLANVNRWTPGTTNSVGNTTAP